MKRHFAERLLSAVICVLLLVLCIALAIHEPSDANAQAQTQSLINDQPSWAWQYAPAVKGAELDLVEDSTEVQLEIGEPQIVRDETSYSAVVPITLVRRQMAVFEASTEIRLE